ELQQRKRRHLSDDCFTQVVHNAVVKLQANSFGWQCDHLQQFATRRRRWRKACVEFLGERLYRREVQRLFSHVLTYDQHNLELDVGGLSQCDQGGSEGITLRWIAAQGEDFFKLVDDKDGRTITRRKIDKIADRIRLSFQPVFFWETPVWEGGGVVFLS